MTEITEKAPPGGPGAEVLKSMQSDDTVTEALDASTDSAPAVKQIDYNVRPLYRVRRPLHYKDRVIPHGSMHRLEKVPREAIRRLAERGSITEVQPPPLFVLPGWTRRAERLELAGIVNAVQLLGADVDQVAEYMRVKPHTVARWQQDVMDWLTAPSNSG